MVKTKIEKHFFHYSTPLLKNLKGLPTAFGIKKKNLSSAFQSFGN